MLGCGEGPHFSACGRETRSAAGLMLLQGGRRLLRLLAPLLPGCSCILRKAAGPHLKVTVMPHPSLHCHLRPQILYERRLSAAISSRLRLGRHIQRAVQRFLNAEGPDLKPNPTSFFIPKVGVSRNYYIWCVCVCVFHYLSLFLRVCFDVCVCACAFACLSVSLSVSELAAKKLTTPVPMPESLKTDLSSVICSTLPQGASPTCFPAIEAPYHAAKP